MNGTMKRWLARGTFVALVAVAMVVAGPRRVAAFTCPDPNAGTCPPLNNGTCADACRSLGYDSGGSCVATCCTCFTR